MEFDNLADANAMIQLLIQQRDSIQNVYLRQVLDFQKACKRIEQLESEEKK